MAKGGNGGSKPSTNGSSYVKGTGSADLLTDLGLTNATLAGGRGDDTYVVYNSDTTIVEAQGEGFDTVQTGLEWTLDSGVEKLMLTGTGDVSGTGNGLDNVLLGNSGANALFGLAGADHLDGGDGDDSLYGGDGDDTLIGGAGDDLLDGGLGMDVAVFGGLSRDFAFSRDGSNIVVVGAFGTDILRDVETLRFDDRDISVSDLFAGPLAVEDDATGTEDSAVTIRVLDNDVGQGIRVTVAHDGAKGVVTINTDGTVTYRPNANANGADSFIYTISDANGLTSSTTVTLSIAAVNDAPEAVADSFTTTEGATLSGAVLGNDSDPDGDTLMVSAYDQMSAAGGAITMAPDGNFSYTAASGFAGTDSFRYTVSDGNGGAATATVSVRVEAPPDPGAPSYYVDALLAPNDWNRLNYPEPHSTGATVTFAFAEVTPSYYDPESFAWSNFQAFSAEQREAARQSLQLIESYSGLTFVETSLDDAEMVFGIADLGRKGFAYWPSHDGVGETASDVWIDNSLAGFEFLPGTSAYKTLIHEIGHAIGFTHPDLPPEEETRKFSVMAGYLHPTMGIEEPSSYMPYDIAAMQYLYGANMSHALGNDTYGFGALDGTIQTIWDAGGHDVLDLSGATFSVALDLRAGHYSTVTASGSDNLAIAFGTTIEDAVGGAYGDRIVGNEADNRLTGGGGSDVFGFAANWGDDVIADFVRGVDSLDFGAAGIGYADLEITSSGGNTTLAYGDDSVLLIGVETIGQGDFLIS